MLLGADAGMTRGAAHRRTGRAVATAICIAALALTACNSRRNQAIPVASAADLPATSTAAPMPAATTDGTPERTTVAAIPADGDVAPDNVTSFESAEPADPDDIMGLDRGEVEALLGEPGLVRHDSPAEVWQYQSGGCVLDLFLYEDAAEFEVVYIEARTGQAITAATDSCLGAVIGQRGTPTS
jgi:hypothetical protein